MPSNTITVDMFGNAFFRSFKYKKIETETIKLPVIPDSSIDLDYMERYIHALEKLTIASVVREKDRIIAETRKYC